MAKNKVNCKCCGKIGFKVGDGFQGTDGKKFYKVNSNSTKFYYVCDFCGITNKSYTTTNNVEYGTMTQNGLTYGIELETDREAKQRTIQSNFLHEHGFIPTKDCTVGTEWKSPIWQSLNPTAKLFISMEKYCNEGTITFPSNCGTHINIGHVELEEKMYMYLIREYFHQLFDRVSDFLEEHPQVCKNVFGRTLNTWSKNTTYYDYDYKYVWVNVKKNNRIEYRIPKFTGNGIQFRNTMKLCRDITTCIFNNFCSNYNNDKQAEKFASMHDYRSYKAELTSDKIIKLIKKYNDMM